MNRLTDYPSFAPPIPGLRPLSGPLAWLLGPLPNSRLITKIENFACCQAQLCGDDLQRLEGWRIDATLYKGDEIGRHADQFSELFLGQALLYPQIT